MSEAAIHGEGHAKPALPNFSGRIPELDGLRGIAIGMVVFHHYIGLRLPIPPGTTLSYLMVSARLAWTGVDLFFVLSGFLIGGILLDARASSNYFQVFYTRRFFRIVPLYLIFLVIAVGLNVFSVLGDPSVSDGGLAKPLPAAPFFFFLQNLWMANAASLGAGALVVTWSLAVEEQFYLTLPLLVRFIAGRSFLACVLAGISLAPLSRVAIAVFWPQNGIAPYALMPCRADALLLGVLGAMLLRDEQWRSRLERRRSTLLLVLLPLTVGLGVLSLRSPLPFSFAMRTVGYTLLAMFYVCILLCALLYREGWFGAILRSGWLTWLGSVAYGTYLFHVLIRILLQHAFLRVPFGSPMSRVLGTSILALALTLGICWLSWMFFEKPLVNIGHRAKYRFGFTGQSAGIQALPAEGN